MNLAIPPYYLRGVRFINSISTLNSPLYNQKYCLCSQFHALISFYLCIIPSITLKPNKYSIIFMKSVDGFVISVVNKLFYSLPYIAFWGLLLSTLFLTRVRTYWHRVVAILFIFFWIFSILLALLHSQSLIGYIRSQAFISCF